MPVTDETYDAALALLGELSTDHGFTASTTEIDNYHRIWARDAVICGFAALLSGEALLIETFQRTLETLRDTQNDTGMIAMNVAIDGSDVTYGESVGRVDPTLWYVVGVCQYILHQNEPRLLDEFEASLRNALHFLRCIELNDRGLIYVPHGGDWADEYINHGYVLFDEVLYLLALASHARVTGDSWSAERAELVRKLLAANYFPGWAEAGDSAVYNNVIFETSRERWEPPLPLAYFNNYTAGYHADLLGVSLLLHTENVVSDEQYEEIAHTVKARYLSKDSPILPSFDPPVTEADPCAWDDLKLNYRYRFKNKPYEYHNGGRWPLINGFFLSTKHDNADLLESFAALLERDEHLFPEFYHGKTYEAAGTPHHAFTAASYIIAHQNIATGHPVFL